MRTMRRMSCNSKTSGGICVYLEEYVLLEGGNKDGLSVSAAPDTLGRTTNVAIRTIDEFLGGQGMEMAPLSEERFGAPVDIAVSSLAFFSVNLKYSSRGVAPARTVFTSSRLR